MTFIEIFDRIIQTNLINFLIMVSILVWIFKKFKLGIFVDKMAEEIQNSVTSSAHAVQSAFSEYKKIKRESKNTDLKKEKIINNAKNIAKNLEEKNKQECESRILELNRTAEKSAEFLREVKIKKTAEKIQSAVYLSSVDTIVDMLDERLQERIIFNSLDELDKISLGAKL